jgi:hypothetical protein
MKICLWLLVKHVFSTATWGYEREVIRKYKEWNLANSFNQTLCCIPIKRKTLGCWCRPDACHGDLLASTWNAGHFCYSLF